MSRFQRLVRPRAEIRVLLCDDAAELRDLLRTRLERDRRVRIVGVAGDGDAARALARDRRPDVIVCDLSMPGAAPPALVRSLRAVAPHATIAVFSGHDIGMLGDAAADVDAYMAKTTDLAAVAAAVVRLGREPLRRAGGAPRPPAEMR